MSARRQKEYQPGAAQWLLHRQKGSLFGYGFGVAAATDPDYGDVVLAEYTLPFNEADVTCYRPLYLRTVVALDHFPIHVTADAAFDYCYVYETVARELDIAAIPLGHPWPRRSAPRSRWHPALLERLAHVPDLPV